MEILRRLNFSLCATEQYTGEGHWSFERKSSLVEYQILCSFFSIKKGVSNKAAIISCNSSPSLRKDSIST